jgi:hypothetical protein
MFPFVTHAGGLRTPARTGCSPDVWLFQSALDQRNEPLDGIKPVLFLGAVSFGFNKQQAISRHPTAGQLDQAFFDFQIQRGGIADIKTEKNRRRDLIYVLTTWA